MSGPLDEPVSVRVQVCATSANLGPGFDSLGLALGVFDQVEVRVGGEPGVRVTVHGEGVGEVSDGEDHLVVRALRRGLDAAGWTQPDSLELVCRNTIPHGRGLGSSAAAVVAGLVAARALAGPGAGSGGLDDEQLLCLATEFEGHPDNAAAALLGGLTLAWTEPAGPRAVRLEPRPDVVAVLLVPTSRLATHHARSVLPTSVAHADAAANSARAALLVHAMTQDPDLLLPATEDRLHQRQRAAAMPQTIEVVEELRARGLAAVVSGAGPSVLVLGVGDAEALRTRCAATAAAHWRALAPALVAHGATVVAVGDEAVAGPSDRLA
ncbi:homoserine kinase [Angustibacter luteus]|uniref:Homoserine kinase n=1 Tax=Angustibacter luteus TaxID=658456 RepID=A0ABW1JHI5_9ACTN